MPAQHSAQSRCSINVKESDSHIKHPAGCAVHRGGRLPLTATVLPPPLFHHLLHPGWIMRNTLSSFPPPKGKAVPYARNPVFPDLGRTGSPLSFRPQAKCYLLREAFSSHFSLQGSLSHHAVISPDNWQGAVMTGLASLPVFCHTRLPSSERETSCVSHGWDSLG